MSTTTPTPKGSRLGWQLMALFVQCFPPDAMVEHYVDYFLRSRTIDEHARCLVKLMYERVRTGPLRKVPEEHQIQQMLTAADTSYPRLSAADDARPVSRSTAHTTLNAAEAAGSNQSASCVYAGGFPMPPPSAHAGGLPMLPPSAHAGPGSSPEPTHGFPMPPVRHLGRRMTGDI